MARAQQREKVRRIGVLMAHREGDPEFQDYLSAFRQGLQKLGWVEDRNIQIDTRWGALDDKEVRQQSAKEILALNPDIILTQNTPPTASMLQQTQTVPVVFVIVTDPVGSGFVRSLSRSGGNATGFTIMEPTTSGKWLELLKDIAPQTTRAAFLFNPRTAPFANYYLNPFKAAAASLGVEAVAATVDSKSDLETVFATQAQSPDTGLVVMPDGFLNVYRTEIVTLAARYRLPAIYPWRFFTELGGLMSYGFDQRDSFLTAATYIDRIMKGEKPADLPVQAPTKYELVINRKTAKMLGLTLAASLAARADDLIE
ncbi:MAG TPA: ABC transporter substrate-binding protein [Pseudolabrys sp.]|nr:ABC transporter substrate-binding protein [Pseudolabrys sp.]